MVRQVENFSLLYAIISSTVANGIGRLTSVTDLSGMTTFSHDARGDIERRVRSIHGLPGSFEHVYGYDWNDRLIDKYFPDPAATFQENIYNADGTLSEVRVDGALYASFPEYNAERQVRRKELHAAAAPIAASNYGYDDFGQLQALRTKASVTLFQDYFYPWHR